MENFKNKMDILLLQEHWLFDHELYLLDEIHTQFCGKGKAVDSDSSTCDLFIRSHRGYGGVAIIWDRTIDQYVKPLDDGNNRIQCIELSIKKPVLIVSAYLPTKADNDKYDEYSECIDQLFELIQKYDTTHDVIIGGDFNEDISKTNNSRRARKLKKFIEECNMKIDLKGPTFINVKGVEVSEIDYFIYKVNNSRNLESTRLVDIPSNVSDHYPIKVILPCALTKKDPLENNIQSRIRWNKVDTERYSDIINKQIPVLLEKLNIQEDSITNRVEETMEILSASAKTCCTQKSYGKNKLKLKIWNPQIKDSLHQNKTAYKIWKDEGRPNDPDHPSVRRKKETRRVFRSEIRKEENKRKHVERDRIITANTQDKRLFYQLVKKQRNNKNIFINDLHVANNKYEHEEVIEGWHEHFKTLAEPISNSTYDGKHQDLCEMDYKAIKTICDQVPPRSVSRSELLEAIKAINTGKSEDIFGLSIEHILYAGDDFTDYLLILVNIILQNKLIPEIIKLGLLSPIFKNKGNKNESKNYRGIVVLPILCKILEYIARINFRPVLLKNQSPLQRGFTPNTSPLNAAVIFEEVYRQYSDKNSPFYIALLDAKSAFDVVIINMLMRKLFLLDIDPTTWSLIDDLHLNTSCNIKWKNQLSKEFKVHQGVKQGGLLSADLYKLYIEDLLSLYETSNQGCMIGHININAVACADDIAVLSDNPYDLQILINHALQYSQLHHYTLQPQKSVIIEVDNKSRKATNHNCVYNLNNQEMPNVTSSSHLGIIRSTSRMRSETLHVEQNTTKARRTAYSLLSAGFHGTNGLDPVTSISIYKTYIQPVLTYGLEILQPGPSNMTKLEKFQKSLLKKVLSLPPNTPDPAIYIISGVLPIEASIDTKCLTLFNNICRQDDKSVEKQLAYRQLHIELDSSSSWYVITKKLLYKYGFSDIFQFLDNPPSKYEWKKLIQKKTDSYWVQRITHDCTFYSSLIHLNCDTFLPRSCHPIIDLENDNNPSKGALSIGIKLKMVTGTYMTQAKRASFTKHESPTCKLCDQDNEDIEHLLLKCKILENIRQPFIKQLDDLLIKETTISFHNINTDSKLQLILDCSKINELQTDIILNKKGEQNCELISRKLCFALHSIRARTIIQHKEKKKVKLKL